VLELLAAAAAEAERASATKQPSAAPLGAGHEVVDCKDKFAGDTLVDGGDATGVLDDDDGSSTTDDHSSMDHDAWPQDGAASMDGLDSGHLVTHSGSLSGDRLHSLRHRRGTSTLESTAIMQRAGSSDLLPHSLARVEEIRRRVQGRLQRRAVSGLNSIYDKTSQGLTHLRQTVNVIQVRRRRWRDVFLAECLFQFPDDRRWRVPVGWPWQTVELTISEQMQRLIEVLQMGQQFVYLRAQTLSEQVSLQRDQLLQAMAAITAHVRREIVAALKRVVDVRRCVAWLRLLYAAPSANKPVRTRADVVREASSPQSVASSAGILPAPARTRVKEFILSLPARWVRAKVVRRAFFTTAFLKKWPTETLLPWRNPFMRHRMRWRAT